MTTPQAEPTSPSSSLSADLLVVEDDPAITEVISASLERSGYVVRSVTGADEAHRAINVREPDLLLLDLGLPDRDGITLCRELRTWFRNPIIVITADGDENNKVAALDSGADDYVTKPFSMPELLARVRVALRHRQLLAAVVDPGTISVGDLTIDTGSHEATTSSGPLVLTRKEFDLLSLLARNPDHMLRHATILEQVWGSDGGSTESLRVHVTKLRRKLGDGPDRPRLVTEPGVGYRLATPAR